MDTIVLKFGGSSVSDNIKLNIVADKIKEFYKENNVVVVVSAQGKTTDNLLREAHELSNVPNERELDITEQFHLQDGKLEYLQAKQINQQL